MKKLTTLLLLTGLAGFSVLLSSCANKDKEEVAEAPVEQPKKPVVKRTVAKAPAPVADDATAAFLVPQSDTNLPTNEQLEEGKASSIGTGNKNVTTPGSQPSTAIKPPSTAPVDDLAPAEP